MLILRDYQFDLRDQARAHFKSGARSVLIQAPTGSGKTVLGATMLRDAASRGFYSWFCVHRRELINQSAMTFKQADIPYGIIAAGYWTDARAPIQICSIQTLSRRLNKIKRQPRFIFFDEAHHSAAATWDRIFKAFPDAYIIGLTATPQRLDGKGLHTYFDAMVHGPPVAHLIDEGWLSPFRVFCPPGIKVQGVQTRMGDYDKRALNAAVGASTVTGDAVKHYLANLKGRRILLRTVSVKHSKIMANEFKAAGVPALHVDGETLPEVREAAMKSFIAGDTLVLCNVDLFSEGIDVPSVAGVSDLRPTQSLTLALQFWGRAMRPEWAKGMPMSTAQDRREAIEAGPKTEALILDHAGNCERFGLPDTDRKWSLEGGIGAKEQNGGGPALRICPKCFTGQPFGKPLCVQCGLEFPIQSREVDYVDGDLVEANDFAYGKIDTSTSYKGSLDMTDLIGLGKLRGYKRPELWAKAVFNKRQARRLGIR